MKISRAKEEDLVMFPDISNDIVIYVVDGTKEGGQQKKRTKKKITLRTSLPLRKIIIQITLKTMSCGNNNTPPKKVPPSRSLLTVSSSAPLLPPMATVKIIAAMRNPVPPSSCQLSHIQEQLKKVLTSQQIFGILSLEDDY